MNVNPGELNKRIKIYNRGKTALIHTCWAKAKNVSGAKIVKSTADFEQKITRFLIRYTSNTIDSSCVIVLGEEEFDITYVNDYDYSHNYIEIMATSRGWIDSES